MNFGDLLQLEGYDPSTIIVLRHRPSEPSFHRVLPWLAAERHDLFNAYQQTQGPRLESAMRGASHVASFIGHEAGRALFVGLYAIGVTTSLDYDAFWAVPEFRELGALGMRGFTRDKVAEQPTCLRFDLQRTDFYRHWAGRLIVGFPPPERSWWRRAHKNVFPVEAILEDSALEAAIPDWTEIDLSWTDLAVLPARWRAALAQWRGIYLIFDTSDGKAYVGSAYGGDNILGRWQSYAATGHGGNKLLRGRDPRTFRFTILQRLSPDMDPEEVIQIESSWKRRLHTGQPFGLNDN